jgi:hypothetical protein
MRYSETRPQTTYLRNELPGRTSKYNRWLAPALGTQLRFVSESFVNLAWPRASYDPLPGDFPNDRTGIPRRNAAAYA